LLAQIPVTSAWKENSQQLQDNPFAEAVAMDTHIELGNKIPWNIRLNVVLVHEASFRIIKLEKQSVKRVLKDDMHLSMLHLVCLVQLEVMLIQILEFV
jgi:hypothetical protein